MSDAPDLEALARRYLDLWQDQMAAMANDPAVVEALSRTFALMTQGAAAFAQTAADDGADAPSDLDRDAPAGGESSHADRHGPASSPRSARAGSGRPPGPDGGPDGAPPGAAAAGAASGDPGVDVPDLLRRIDALERRVADLDARLRQSDPAGSGP